MLAIDVLLPLPAAPTTSTIPFCFSASSRVTGIGQLEQLHRRDVGRDEAHHDGQADPRWRYTFTRKRPMPGARYDVSYSFRLVEVARARPGCAMTWRATASVSSAVIFSVRK